MPCHHIPAGLKPLAKPVQHVRWHRSMWVLRHLPVQVWSKVDSAQLKGVGLMPATTQYNDTSPAQPASQSISQPAKASVVGCRVQPAGSKEPLVLHGTVLLDQNALTDLAARLVQWCTSCYR